MKVKLFIALLYWFSFGFGQSNKVAHFQTVSFTTTYFKDYQAASVNYSLKVNEILYFGIGAGVLKSDSIVYNYDDYGDKIASKFIKFDLLVPTKVGVESKTKHLIAFGEIQLWLSLRMVAVIPNFGLGYKYKHFKTKVGLNYNKSNMGGTLEAGFNF